MTANYYIIILMIRLTQPGSTERVADVLQQWLADEIVNSDGGRNAYLSEYQDRRNDLFKPFDDQTNNQAQKAKSHYSRFIQWVRPYKEFDFRSDDWFAARLTFASMMNVSGSYRKQCFFESSDEADYLQRRYERPVAIDVHSIIANELSPDSLQVVSEMDEDERLDHIIERSLRVNDESLHLHSSVHSWAMKHRKDSGSIATAEDEPVAAMKQAQTLWAGLAAAHIVVAASFRDGDLARVPFLEPKSITDVTEVNYPFAA